MTDSTRHFINPEILEKAAIAGYNARAKKTGSPPWEDRNADDRRRYREIAEAAIQEYIRLIIERSIG